MDNIPKEMKALICTRYGSPELLEYSSSAPVPEPNVDQVLIQVYAASVNALDWRLCRGNPFPVRFMFGGPFKPRKNGILGADAAGIIVQCGSEVEGWKVGDAVLTDLSHEFQFGSFAEYAVANADMIVSKPSSLSFEEAAALPVAANTAWDALKKFGVIAGQRVLVNGASGGVGLFAVQLAKHWGANVTAVCSTSKIDTVKVCGADQIIDRTKEDFAQQSFKFDLIVDCAARHKPSEIKKILNDNGHYVLVGSLSLKTMMRFALTNNNQFSMISSSPNASNLKEIVQLVEEKKIRTFIDKLFPLSEGAKAVEYIEEGRAKGKIVFCLY